MTYDIKAVRQIAKAESDSKTVTKVVNLALDRVGVQDYGKYDIDSYAGWRPKVAKPPQPLNCWASVVFWAWQAGAIRSDWPRRYTDHYTAQVIDYMKKEAVVTLEKQDVVRQYLLGRLTANLLGKVMTGGERLTAPPGRTIFFKSRHTGPLAHVALTCGGEYVVSNWRLPNATDNDELRAGFVHVETISKLAHHVDTECEVHLTPRPFWELRMCTF